jgi:outer membrane protein assembly factor BamB
MLYIGSCSGFFYAFDRASGFDQWIHDTTVDGPPASFHGNILLIGKTLVVGTDTGEDGYLYGLDRATGIEKWKQKVTGGFPSDPATDGARVFAVTMEGEVRQIDVETGKTIWSHEGNEGARYLKSAIAHTGDRVLVSLPSGSVFALEAGSGATIWETRVDGRPNSSIAVIDESFYVGDVEGRIYRFSIEDGTVQGTYQATSPIYGTLTPTEDCLFALWGEDTLGCLSHDLGKLVWSRTTDDAWSSFHPLIRGEQVWIGNKKGEVFALNRSDGSIAWTYRLEGDIKGLGTKDDVVYIGTFQGRVYAVRIPEL